MLCVPAVFFCIGSVAMLIGVVLDGALAALPGVIIGPLFASGLFAIVRYRWRAMGDFVLDVERGELQRVRGRNVVDTWSLAELQTMTRKWDFLHRGFTQAYWVIAKTQDGRTLRLGKGDAQSVDATLGLVASWGLPVQ